MAMEIVRLYISSLSSFFTLSDAGLAEVPRKDGAELRVPPFVPAGTTVLTACFFAERLVDEVAECVAELGVVDIGSDALNSSRQLVENVRWRMEEVICATWAKGTSADGD
jgi:exocyst complex component 2